MSEWISVKDRLPDESGRYLVANFEHDYVAVLHFSMRHGMFNSFDEFSPMAASDRAIPITHWMPLPEPPEKVQCSQ